MRYLKKLSLYSKDPVDDKFSVYPDGRIVTNSAATLQLPSGNTAQRVTLPAVLTTGTVRYNTTLNEFEVYNPAIYNSGASVTPWEIIRTVRQATITAQNLGYGNYNDTVFGPLAYNISTSKPQNVLVFVDNVYQVPNTNYSLITNPSASTASLSVSTSSNVTTIYLNTITNIDAGESGYWRPVSGVGIQPGTTVTSVSFTFTNQFNGYALGISNPTLTSIPASTVITVSYPNTGTYIQFTGTVPAKPVFSLLGFDGYFPAGPLGNRFES